MFLPLSDILLHFALPLLIAAWAGIQIWRCFNAPTVQSWGPWAILLIGGLGYFAGASFLAMLGAGMSGTVGVQPVNQGACKVAVAQLVGSKGTQELTCDTSSNTGALRTADRSAIIRPVSKGQEVIEAFCWSSKDFDFSGKPVELGKTMGGQPRLRAGCGYGFQCFIDGTDVKVVSVFATRSSDSYNQRCLSGEMGGK